VCRISCTTGVAPTQVWIILHSDCLYPYHLQIVPVTRDDINNTRNSHI
jgi:hypothetical protein